MKWSTLLERVQDLEHGYTEHLARKHRVVCQPPQYSKAIKGPQGGGLMDRRHPASNDVLEYVYLGERVVFPQ